MSLHNLEGEFWGCDDYKIYFSELEVKQRAIFLGEVTQPSVWMVTDKVVNVSYDGEFPWAWRELNCVGGFWIFKPLEYKNKEDAEG